MILTSAVIAASLTFTATATGVEKGNPVEFVFAGKNSDRDYETMFILDDSIDNLCLKLEKAGLPRGWPVETESCRLWPVGCQLRFDPPIGNFVDGNVPDASSGVAPIYTGGTRLADGAPVSDKEMPASFFSVYSLAQSPVVYDGIYTQGDMYGKFTAVKTLEKGTRVTFTVTWETNSMPRHVSLTIRPGNAVGVLKQLKSESEKGDVDALVGFDANLTVAEATAAAQALATVDSRHIKINGCTNIFYRSFLPLVKWMDRKERLLQPFELTIGATNRLVFIDEDWSGPGEDPILTPHEILPKDAVQHPKTDTCFIYAEGCTTLDRIFSAMSSIRNSNVHNWYVFQKNEQSLHNTD